VRFVATLQPKNKKKGGECMPLFTIMYIFEVPAKNQIAATDELMIARKNHFEKTFLKKSLSKTLSQNFHRIK
jgi:hypothetical protein